MRPRHRAIAGVVAVVGAGLLGAGAAPRSLAPPTGEPLAVESTALLPLDTESSVAIVGIRGQITVTTIDERELRVISRGLGPQGAERPVGIWQDGSKLIVAAAAGTDTGPRVLSVEVPKAFAIALDTADSDVVLHGEGGVVDLRGTNLRATVQLAGGSVTAEVVGGTLTVQNTKDVTARVRGTAASFGGVSGSLSVHAAGGTVALKAIEGSTDLEADDTMLILNGLSGSVHVKAQKGDAKVSGLKAGAELELVGTPLHLKDGQGTISVTSDASVDFEAMAASMRFDMYGGSIRGKGNDGTIEVRTRATDVNVESISKGLRIQGDGLTARIVDVGGELHVETTSSEIVVDRAEDVVLKVDRGNITVQRATGTVQANVLDGDVRIIDGSGPVTLEIERGDAEVSWASLSGDKDSQLVNKSGNLTVRMPTSGACRVEAKSHDGRVDSDLPTVRVMDDLTEAQGPVNNGNRPIVKIVANGDIHLLDAAKAP